MMIGTSDSAAAYNTCANKLWTKPIVREPGGSIGTNFGSKAHSDF